MLGALSLSKGAADVAFRVLDTTDAATVRRVAEEAPVEKTLFIVASKSGTTSETLALRDYFREKVQAARGDRTGEHFVAITDPGTPLASQAMEQGYRRVFLNFPDIGGRYSAPVSYTHLRAHET